jgi:hypothetical protein
LIDFILNVCCFIAIFITLKHFSLFIFQNGCNNQKGILGGNSSAKTFGTQLRRTW